VNADCVLLFVTVPDLENAKKIARGLVSEKLAACVNIAAEFQSVYRWEGKIEESNERLLLIKTLRDNFTKAESWIKKNHPYSVPEIIAVPILEGSSDYLNWLKESVR